MQNKDLDKYHKPP